jgi:hypothetical protein
LDNAMMLHTDELSYASWTTIRAHLMSQEAEIERLQSRLAAANERLEATERTLTRCKQTLDTTSECWRLDAERLKAIEKGASGQATVQGMTLRDYFAAKATNADVEAARLGSEDPEDTGVRCRARFRYADAMLAARL